MRFAWFATVRPSVLDGRLLADGRLGNQGYYHRVVDDTLYVRLLVYCGTFTDEDFAAHICELMGGGAIALPGALRAACCEMRLDEAEEWGLPLGFSCWNPACSRVSLAVLPMDLRPIFGDRRRAQRFKACSACKFAHYCSDDCQRADWRCHKRTCSPVGRADSAVARSADHAEQWIHTAYGFGDVYSFCLWKHALSRVRNLRA